MQGLDTETKMPETFIFDMKRKDKVKRAMNTKKNLVKAAVAVLALGISGGTAFAATQQFRAVKQLECGLASGNWENGDTSEMTVSALDAPEMEVSDTDDTTTVEGKKDTTTAESKNDGGFKDFYKEKLVSTENGNDETAWLKKEVYKITDRTYESDDAKNWKLGELETRSKTVYTYKDYAAACEDVGFVNLFTKTYEQAEEVYYQETSDDNGESDMIPGMSTTFKYKEGRISLMTDKYLKEDNEILERATMVITGEETSNHREYVSKNGYKFQLSDDTSFGEVRTTTMLSFGDYEVVIHFTGLSDQEIHEVLDTILQK